MTYYVSTVPGQNLMRDQVWDISWKLGNTAGNGGVVSGELCTKCGTKGAFARIFPSHIHLWPTNLA